VILVHDENGGGEEEEVKEEEETNRENDPVPNRVRVTNVTALLPIFWAYQLRTFTEIPITCASNQGYQENICFCRTYALVESMIKPVLTRTMGAPMANSA
jgi:hypothetical protein